MKRPVYEIVDYVPFSGRTRRYRYEQFDRPIAEKASRILSQNKAAKITPTVRALVEQGLSNNLEQDLDTVVRRIIRRIKADF